MCKLKAAKQTAEVLEILSGSNMVAMKKRLVRVQIGRHIDLLPFLVKERKGKELYLIVKSYSTEALIRDTVNWN